MNTKQEITLSEFLSIIQNNDYDKLEKIERDYDINVFSEKTWYGLKITIDENIECKTIYYK